jgi:hypothetical protein
VKIYRIAEVISENKEDTVSGHVDDVLSANLSYPIFITSDGLIIDGMHRTLKAILEDRLINVIMISSEEIEFASLNPRDSYVGQVYISDFNGEQKEYSIDRIISLYSSNPTVTLEPDKLLKNNIDGWGGLDPYVVLEEARKTKVKIK